MRKTIVIVLSAGALALGLAPAALANHVPSEGCGTPQALSGADGNGSYAGVCTPLGSLVVGGATDRGGYIYADGANQNPAPLGGYLVVGAKTDGSVFARCSGNADQWDETFSGSCP
jgi:hypothetical protein